jgi:uncharacterized membrane protein YedE/YeeE
LIGTSAALFLLITGRIAGISGLVAAATRIADSGPRWWHAAAFIVGLPLGAWFIASFVRAPGMGVTTSVPLLVGAGLLVGVGTRLGNGCTSGHGVCGIARLSPRSMAATATFMAAGFATVFVMRHVVGG